METMISSLVSDPAVPRECPGASQSKHQLHVNGSLLRQPCREVSGEKATLNCF